MKKRIIQIIIPGHSSETISDLDLDQPILMHESAEKQVSGEALYLDDYPTPQGMLHGAVISTEISKGQLTACDLTQVLQQPGVVAVYQYRDIPGQTDIAPLTDGDPLLCDGEIKYHCQPVALVLATSPQAAWKAATFARLSYHEDQPAISYTQAKAQPPLMPPLHLGESIKEADLHHSAFYMEGSLSSGGQEHLYLETQASMATPTEDGGMFIRSSTQNPSEVQAMAARTLGISLNRVTVDTRRIGGGFGGKETNANQWACLAALGASLSGKSVRIRLPRSNDIRMTGKRHPFISHYQLAASPDGIIQAAKMELNALCGHSADLSPAIMTRALLHTDNAYCLNRADITGHLLRTDTVSNTAFRGFGAPQAALLIEKAVQDLSIKTGQDALDIRLKNLYRSGHDTTHYAMRVNQHQTLQTIIDQLIQNSNYRQRRSEIEEFNRQSPVIKKGLALTPVKFGIAFTTTFLNQAGALIHIYTDGSVQVSHGGTEMGQGLHTKIQQIVARTLGIPLTKVLIAATRTDKVPNTSATAASSGSDLNGMAACRAATKLKQRLLDFAVNHFQLMQKPDICDGMLVASDTVTTDPIASWEELVQQAWLSRVSLSATGFYKTPKIHFDPQTGRGRPFYYFSLGAACSEVRLDTLTGEMRLSRVDLLHEVGDSLNPAIDCGQIEGAFIQGLGWLTCEELLWNEQGALLTTTPAQYKIPTQSDYPECMNISLYNSANPEPTIFHSKAIGEPPFLLAISVWCAIYNAVTAISGHRYPADLNAPATPEQILHACDSQRAHMEPQDEEQQDDR